MASPTTIHDLPDDMLHEIFGHVFAGGEENPVLLTYYPPEGTHAALRCVCRRWRDIADWVWLSKSHICVETSTLADAGVVRARHPAAFKHLLLACQTSRTIHSLSVAHTAAVLITASADLRRSLLSLALHACCLPALSPAVAPVASCTALTNLCLSWRSHKKERVVPSNVLAPLSALRMLKVLIYEPGVGGEAPTSPHALLPALPDAPRLTHLVLQTAGNFVPVGSDAALGRLRRLTLKHAAPVQKLVDAEDPFLLRAAFDAGPWQPSRLTGLQELIVTFGPVRGSRAPSRRPPTGSRAGSEWAPLADQVTALSVTVESDGYKRPSTGIVAGLGVLTALRGLAVTADLSFLAHLTDPGLLEPVSIDRLRAPDLTQLVFTCASTPVSVARFPNLVQLQLGSIWTQPPLKLRSLVARSSLTSLNVIHRELSSPSLINLAELFVGGGSWPVLEKLILRNMVLEWDATGLAGAPTAAEFAQRARQLLPALFDVEIEEPRGRAALPDRSRVGFVVACRRHVVPALLGLRGGRR